MSKDTIIGLRLDKATKEKLKKIAEQDNRSLSNLIQVILMDYVEEKRSR
jgi:predicted transcriptional regulator